MGEGGLNMLIGALAGAGLATTAVLLVEYLRHRWKMAEHYKEVLAERKIAACNKLMKSLYEVVKDISPIVYGVEPLRWPKDRRVSPNPSRDSTERAQRIHQQLTDLSYFVTTNEMVLGSKINRVWYKYYKALTYLKYSITTNTQRDLSAANALDKLLTEWTDKMGEAVRTELQGVAIEFITAGMLNDLSQEGQELAKALLAKSEEEVNKNKMNQVPARMPARQDNPVRTPPRHDVHVRTDVRPGGPPGRSV